VLAIDAPFFGLVIDIDGIMKEARKVKLMGFTGKLLVHPRHVEPSTRSLPLQKRKSVLPTG